MEDKGLNPAPTFDSGFSTPEMTAIWSSEAAVRSFLDFEAALALALADAGIAPAAEAHLVAEACRAPLGDPDSMLAGTWEAGTPMIAIVERVRDRLDDEAARGWVHHGATSQDAIDTGRMLQSRVALEHLEGQVLEIAAVVAGMVETYRDQPQMGRTFLQDSRPTTFGWRAGTWLSSLMDGLEDLTAQRARLRVQLAGPDGAMGPYGASGPEVRSALATRLGLTAPGMSWHTDRAPIWQMSRAVESIALTMSKIGLDVALLAQSSLEEVKVRPGQSSSMPGKRNPIDSVHAVAAAQACSGFVAMIVASRHELDRGVGGWHVEWLALPMLFQTASAAVAAMTRCLGSLDVDADAMSANLSGVGGDIPDPRQLDTVLERFRAL